MNQQTSYSNMINPVGTRLSNNDVSSGEMTCVNPTHDTRSLGGWNSGESSSNLQNEFDDDGVQMEERCSSSVNSHALVDDTLEAMQFEPSNVLFRRRASIDINGNQVRTGPLLLQESSSNHVQPNPNPNAGCVGDNTNDECSTGVLLGPNLFTSRGVEIKQASSSVASDDVGTSSGSSGYMVEEANDGSGSSLGSWGLSCKRKALEGTSGSSSCFPQAENVASHSSPPHENVSSSLSLSTPSTNSSTASPSLLVMRGVHPDAFSSTSVSDPPRNFERRASPGQEQEPLTFSLSSTEGAWRSPVWPPNQSTRPAPSSESVDLRTTAAAAVNSSATQGRSHAIHTPTSSRYMRAFLWNGLSNSRSGNPSGSLNPGERGGVFREDLNLRSTTRNSAEQPMFVPLTEVRSIAQNPPGWSMAGGNVSSSGSLPSSRIGPSSTSHHLATPSWISNHSSTTHNHQRFSEFVPWSLFPSVESEPEPSGHFSPLSGPPAPSQETLMSVGSSSQNHNQSFPRSEFLMEGQGDDILGVPRSVSALAADIEGRHRLISEIRQVLNAMRRGENIQVEDYMLFDPFVYHRPAEIHDRHRDMRLDVDNMSYEELLALEERIGNVSTGLSEKTILKSMTQKKFVSITTESPPDVEPCCICQEEYEDGNDLGMLDCGHDFHTDCIKQWLMQKNLCPICKMTALPT